MSLRIGMLTSGGDCQALNVAMRGVAKTLFAQRDDVVIYGFLDGYEGLVSANYRTMTSKDFSGILTMGGTILGTSRMPFKYINVPDEQGRDKVACMVNTYKNLQLDCLVVLGGNGSHKTAGLLKSKGLNVVSLPKTIDNDIEGTDLSFGFTSAIDVATKAIDEIHTTATSHGRIFIVELMGHKTGWLTLYSGIAGGADVVLLPEVPYDFEKIVEVIRRRDKEGKHFTIIAMAEGAMSREEAAMTKKERKAAAAANPYPAVSYKLCAQLSLIFGQKVKVTVPGYVQRGGAPSAYDRLISTRLGVEAANLILNEDYGYMVCVKNNGIEKIAIEEVAGKTKMISPDDPLLAEAESMGICLGR